MMWRVLCLCLAASLAAPAAFCPAAAQPQAATAYVEPPALASLVAAGKLPPVAERLPRSPAIARLDLPWQSPGRHSGELRILMGGAKDVRMMVVYGYARLVVYNTRFEIEPDILERVDVVDGRSFTLRLRQGHKWSDGHPFTAEDFRYFWEDVASNRSLSPIGPPAALVVDGKPAQFEVIDETTVRYSWDAPNPHFLPALAGASPLFIFRPAHYLKKHHARYVDPQELQKSAKQKGARNWAAMHNKLDNQYRNDNPELPTLDPWIVQTRPPAQRFEFRRNPYYHRVDAQGLQLPYIDVVAMTIADGKIIPPKVGAGEADLQARALHFNYYPFLKKGEKDHNYAVRLWRAAKGSHMTLNVNLNHNDPVWRALFRDVRFRRALSIAIDRHEINQVVYFGLAVEGNNTVLADSPLFKPHYRDAWAKFDIKAANKLLDDIGLTKRDSRGVRLLPDGRPMNIVVETAGEETEQTDVMELIHDSLLRAGIKIYTRPSQRDVFRNRIFAGETLVSIWSGYENGLASANTSPAELAPTSQQQLQWPKWGQIHETKGASGEPIDLAPARELAELNRRWEHTIDFAERTRLWHRMLEIHAENVFTIGIVAAVPQPVVISNRLRNVPAEGVYNWDPGAHFGIYRPDSFWFATVGRTAALEPGQ